MATKSPYFNNFNFTNANSSHYFVNEKYNNDESVKTLSTFINSNNPIQIYNSDGSSNKSLFESSKQIALYKPPKGNLNIHMIPNSTSDIIGTLSVTYKNNHLFIDNTKTINIISYGSYLDSDKHDQLCYVFKFNNKYYCAIIGYTGDDTAYQIPNKRTSGIYRYNMNSKNYSCIFDRKLIITEKLINIKKELGLDYIKIILNGEEFTSNAQLNLIQRCIYKPSNNICGIPVTGWSNEAVREFVGPKKNNIASAKYQVWLRVRIDLNEPIYGWVLYYTSNTLEFSYTGGIFTGTLYPNITETPTKESLDQIDANGKPRNKDDYGPEANDNGGGGSSGKSNDVLPDSNPDYDNDEEYYKYLQQKDLEYDLEYWTRSNETDGQYSLKSHNSIIGLPLQFMGNVDLRPGASTYGKDYLENILYDMNIAIIKPGGPVLNPKWDDSYASYSDSVFNKTIRSAAKFAAYWDQLKQKGVGNFLQDCLFQLFKGSSARFYSFMQDYTHYTHYVNTLCHLFVTYLGISDKTYINARGDVKTYGEYTDDIKEIETDEGYGLKQQMGFDNAVYMYYSDEGSSLNQNFTNQTMTSGLSSTLNEASNAVKEWGFLINAAGIESGNNGIVDLRDASNFASRYKNTVLGRLLSGATEGVTTILAGNNISLPEIYSDSDTTVQHTFKVKLVSPYGDPESVFLYVLRPLARMLAFSLPRQFSANSYGSPFIVQAFSKGQFNCQLGIVTELSITRCGNGGESHTIHHIPTELEVSITIADMYEKVFLSNEYYGNGPGKSLLAAAIDTITGDDTGTKFLQFLSTNTAARLIFNNVGLIDFCASFCGYNLNTPPYTSGWKTIVHMMHNRTAEYITHSENDGWLFPQWGKMFNDSFNQAVQNLTTPLTTLS